ncbi:MAG: translation initiation factor eIF-2B [Candidatus Binatia bacterium]
MIPSTVPPSSAMIAKRKGIVASRFTMEIDSLIAEIISDNISGAQELTSKAGSLVCRFTEEKRSSTLEELRGALLAVGVTLLRAQPALAPFFNLLDRALPELDLAPNGLAAAQAIHRATQAFIEKMEANNQTISAYIFHLIKEGDVVLTHSASRSVREALSHCWKKGKRFSVICTESRPACEGALLARHLAEQGIPTTLTTDALPPSLMTVPRHTHKEISIVLVGADSVSLHGLTNKAGTLGLAMAARDCSIPFYALAGSEKFIPSTFSPDRTIQDKPPEEILASPPEELKIINRYFDITPLPYLTAVVTEKGTLRPRDLIAYLEKLTPHPQLIAALSEQ